MCIDYAQSSFFSSTIRPWSKILKKELAVTFLSDFLKSEENELWHFLCPES